MVDICIGGNFKLSIKNITRVWNRNGIRRDNLSLLTKPTHKVPFPLQEKDLNIIEALKENTTKIKCAGIAANQLGFDRNIFIGLIDHLTDQFDIFINPEIIEKTENSIQSGFKSDDDLKENLMNDFYDRDSQSYEGCLSIPGMLMSFDRYDKIKVRYQTEGGETIIKDLDGIYSRIFQHETDHLNGIIILDRFLELEGSIMDDYSSEYDSITPHNYDKGLKDLFSWLKDSYFCPNIVLKDTLPYIGGKWYMCTSPIKQHSCTKDEVQNLCMTTTRNFRKCDYYEGSR